ncbi:MAG: hypothetical protein KC657_33690 [Myxococcales bacterium]|nr:hypothetical protein [Myxococcales bacterium]
MSRFVRPLISALPFVVVACSNAGDGGEAVGTVAHELREAELPKSAELDYSVRQDEARWELGVTIRPYKDGRRIALEQRVDGTKKRSVAITDRNGALDRQNDRAAAWMRIDAMSTPGTLGVGRAWRPFGGIERTEPGKGAVVNDSRSYIVTDTWDVEGGLRYRAVFNVRPVVERNPEGLKGAWPFADSVYGVGVADWFMPSGSSTSYLLASAEYTFLTPSRPSSLAVKDANELRARIGAVPHMTTVTCLEKGPASVLAARRTSSRGDTAFALTSCAQ